MSKYHVGDFVMIRNDLKAGRRYGIDTFVDAMEPLRGKEVEIERVTKKGKYWVVGGPCYNWTDEMIAGLSRPRYKVGDRVIVREDLENGATYGIDLEGGRCYVTGGFSGKTVTIAAVERYSDKSIRYRIQEDGRAWWWTDDMFDALKDGEAKNEFDCSLADDALFTGSIVCSYSEHENIIPVGTLLTIKDGRCEYRGRVLHHIFGISGLQYAFWKLFDANNVEFIKIREAC